MVSFIQPLVSGTITGGAGLPSGPGGSSEGISIWTTIEELLPVIGVRWKVSCAKPETQVTAPLSVHSEPKVTVTFALPCILIVSETEVDLSQVDPV